MKSNQPKIIKNSKKISSPLSKWYYFIPFLLLVPAVSASLNVDSIWAQQEYLAHQTSIDTLEKYAPKGAFSNSKKKISKGYNQLFRAHNFYSAAQFDSAIICAKEALENIPPWGVRRRQFGLNILALSHFQTFDFEKAHGYAGKLKSHKQPNFSSLISATYFAEIYQKDSARFYLEKALDARNPKAIELDEEGIHYCLNLAGIYSAIEDIEKAENWINRASEGLNSYPKNNLLNLDHKRMQGELLLAKDLIDNALASLMPLSFKLKKYNLSDRYRSVLLSIAKAHLHKHEYDSSEVYFIKALELSQKNKAAIVRTFLRHGEDLNERFQAFDNANQPSTSAILKVLFPILITAIIALTLLLLRVQKNQKSTQRKLLTQQTDLKNQKLDMLLKSKEIGSLNQVLQSQEKEREQLANEIHDRLGGMLSSVKYQFSSLNERIGKEPANSGVIKKITIMLDSTIAEVRKLANKMNASVLSRFGLLAALNDLSEAVETDSGVQIIIDEIDFKNRLSSHVEQSIYRVIQEAINNSLKHASASRIQIQLIQHEDEFHFTVDDDGIGFDIENALEEKKNLGIRGMQGKVQELGGEFTINSTKNKGTFILAVVPTNKEV